MAVERQTTEGDCGAHRSDGCGRSSGKSRRSVAENPLTAVKGCHASGKTFLKIFHRNGLTPKTGTS